MLLTKSPSKWVKVLLPYKVRGRTDCVGEGGGGRLVTHSIDSVITQSVAFKYVMASDPYRDT
jgi:hypothetical protein